MEQKANHAQTWSMRSDTTVPARPRATAGSGLADLGPIEQLRAGRLGRRLVQLAVGLALFGVSVALMVDAGLGAMPWDVLHVGVAGNGPLSVGQVIVLASFVVLLLWIPLREKPGLGTFANAVLVGVTADLTLRVLPASNDLLWRIPEMLVGIVLCAAAGALYIGSQFGRGPRDGLMTGLNRRTGLSLRLVRTGLEVTVVALGLLLGGVAGVGTVLYALAIGPLTQLMLPWATVALPSPDRARRPD
ncbi:conserved membrane hypothetical protein [Nocardioides sp. AX2bis]|nr:conserved membrane hypothetical protein [Nocardioides sp. AX2bis]